MEDKGIALRGLYSTFRNWGQKYVYTLNDGDVPGASIDWRRPDYAVGNLVGSGRHTMSDNWLSWDASILTQAAERLRPTRNSRRRTGKAVLLVARSCSNG